MTIHYAHRRFSELNNEAWEFIYSRMKFGDDNSAKKIGVELADSLYDSHPELFYNRVVIIPAPTDSTIPFASPMLARHMMRRLNMKLLFNGMPRTEWCTIHRTQTYYTNYAGSTEEERKKLLAADELFINRDFIEGKTLIFVDDCTITGTHEQKIEEYIKRLNLPNMYAFACYAHYTGSNARIEHQLNHAEIVTHHDLIQMMNSQFWKEFPYLMTTRAIRMLMELPDREFKKMLGQLTTTQRENLLYYSIEKNYNNHEDYKSNFVTLMDYFPS